MLKHHRPNKFIIAVFPSRRTLISSLDELIKGQSISVEDAAIVARASNGETVVVGDNIRPDEGGLAGGTFGATLGILGLVQLGVLTLPGIGAVLVAIGLGALGGGLIGLATGRLVAHKFTDPGIPEVVMGMLADLLTHGDAALILALENEKDAEKLLGTVNRMKEPLKTKLVDIEQVAVA